MCNLYNITTNRQAVLEFTRAMHDRGGFNEPSRDVFPNYLAPVVRARADGEREIAPLTWGMPTPPERVTGKADRGTTNIRHPHYRHWHQWMGSEHRCVVPATTFAEPSPTKDERGRVPNVWFALGDVRPLFFFAGVWASWRGVRKVRDGEQDFELFAFLTTTPNDVVAPVHPKAMPVILTERDDVEAWLTEPWPDAKHLQRPLPDGVLKIVESPEGFFDRNPKLA
ncbi:MAG: SOS response-associated peptidase [Rhizobiaceae bacterium]|nr:SOS response-associated peptidase [Rhizobiaceae bacterium]